MQADPMDAPAATSAPAPPPAVDLDANAPLSLASRFQLGIEREADSDWTNLRDKRLTLITNNSALSTSGRHSIAILAETPRLSLVNVVLINDGEPRSPAVEEAIAANPELIVSEVTAKRPRPGPASYEKNNAFVFDAALPGHRFAAETLVLGAVIEAASLSFKEVIVLDRPTIAPADRPHGPFPGDGDHPPDAFFAPMPMLPAMTAGELAPFINVAYSFNAVVTTTPMKNWRRADGYAWIERDAWRELTASERSAINWLRDEGRFHPGWPLLETVRKLQRPGDYELLEFLPRGNRPPELAVTAARLAPEPLLTRLAERNPPGVEVRPVTNAAGEATTRTVGIAAVSPAEIRPVELALQLTVSAQENMSQLDQLTDSAYLADDNLYEGLKKGFPASQIRELWESTPVWRRFLEDRESYLLYN